MLKYVCLFLGMNWFKRVYVTSASWENQQHITYSQAGNPTWSVSGISKLCLTHISVFCHFSYVIYFLAIVCTWAPNFNF